MDRQAILARTEAHVRARFADEATGHDWWHMDRVRRMALRIGAAEGADLFVVELGALLHDIADHKFHGGDRTAGPRAAREWLQSVGADGATIEAVCPIVANVSFSGGAASEMQTLEGQVVQDADRLDALGAIGIARVFAYGGRVGRPIHLPDGTQESGTAIQHFYDKLLLLKDRMNTGTAQRIAARRHRLLEQYLNAFLAEWDGRDTND